MQILTDIGQIVTYTQEDIIEMDEHKDEIGKVLGYRIILKKILNTFELAYFNSDEEMEFVFKEIFNLIPCDKIDMNEIKFKYEIEI